jgi:hypothetical protein
VIIESAPVRFVGRKRQSETRPCAQLGFGGGVWPVCGVMDK